MPFNEIYAHHDENQPRTQRLSRLAQVGPTKEKGWERSWLKIIIMSQVDWDGEYDVSVFEKILKNYH